MWDESPGAKNGVLKQDSCCIEKIFGCFGVFGAFENGYSRLCNESHMIESDVLRRDDCFIEAFGCLSEIEVMNCCEELQWYFLMLKTMVALLMKA